MACSRCHDTKTLKKSLNIENYGIEGKIDRIDCSRCFKFIEMKLNDQIINIDNFCYDLRVNEWKEIETNYEKLIYYILCQIIYPEFDPPNSEKFESPFDYADPTDIVILRWVNGKPIGFYTIKPKGTENVLTNEIYNMPVLDTAYIRSEYRGQGYGVEMISDMLKRFPNEDIGFSKPISHGMMNVLKKFLITNKPYRLRFWEIADADLSGSQQLIWYRLRK